MSMPHTSTSSSSPPPKRIWAYLHGFLSGPESFKGQYFQRYLQQHGIDLHLVDLNGPEGYSGISYTGALSQVKSLYESQGGEEGGVVLDLIGSSLGGYIATRYAELYPKHVRRVVAFCPGFDLQSRWPVLFGQEVLKQWEQQGYREFPLASKQDGSTTRIPYTFITDGLTHPPYPHYHCPTLIIHGLHDEVVPITTTYNAIQDPQRGDITTVVVVDDDHALTKDKTLKLACKYLVDFLELPPTATTGDSLPQQGAGGGASTSSTSSAPSSIEVEQKFPMMDDAQDLAKRIELAGGSLKGQVIFTDLYWDLPNNALTLANCWLRQRGGLWELKVPAVEGESPNAMAVASYREITQEEDIIHFLLQRFPHDFRAPSDLSSTTTVSTMLTQAQCESFAKYTTKRTKYTVPPDFVVDVDEAHYGFSVVEVELLCSDPQEIPQARQRIRDLAKVIGLDVGHGEEKKPYKGKLEEYVRRMRPEHYHKLVEAKVFPG